MRRNLPVLCVTIFIALVGVYSWVRLVPLYMQDRFGTSDRQIGTAFMVLAMAFRGSQVLGGWMADRFGRKPMMVGGTLLMAPFYWAAAQADDAVTFVAMMSVCWTIGSIQWPSFLAIVSESVPPERRGRALGWLEFCGIGGVAAGPLIGAELLEQAGFTVRNLMIGTAALYLLIGSTRWALLTETRGAPTMESGSSVASFGDVLIGLVVGVVGMTGFYLAWDGPFPAKHLHDVFHLTDPQVNRVMALCGGAAMVMAFVGGRLIDRFGAPRMMGTAFAIWIAMIGAYFVAPSARGVAFLVVILMPVELFYLSFLKHSASVGAGHRRGFFVGLFGSVSGVMGALGLHFSGRLYELQGFAGPMAVTLGACVVGLLAATLLIYRRRVAIMPTT